MAYKPLNTRKIARMLFDQIAPIVADFNARRIEGFEFGDLGTRLWIQIDMDCPDLPRAYVDKKRNVNHAPVLVALGDDAMITTCRAMYAIGEAAGRGKGKAEALAWLRS